MLTWVLYDIQKNKVRNNVAKICLKAGIYRVQKSVFLGEINSTQRKSLYTEIEGIINKKIDSVYIFPICKEDFKTCILLGQAFDEKLIKNEVKAFFL